MHTQTSVTLSSTTRRLTRSNAGANLEELQALLATAAGSKRGYPSSTGNKSNTDQPVSKKSKDDNTDVATPSPQPAQKKDHGQFPPRFSLPADVNRVSNLGTPDRRRTTAKAAAPKMLKGHIRLKGKGLGRTKVGVRALAEFGDGKKEQGIDQNIGVP